MVKNITKPQTGKSNGSSREGGFEFEAVDVTGTRALDARGVQRTTPAGSVARALVPKMDLPRNVPWNLRDDRTGAYLDEEGPIGDQIETGSRVVLTPKSHLGSGL